MCVPLVERFCCCNLRRGIIMLGLVCLIGGFADSVVWFTPEKNKRYSMFTKEHYGCRDTEKYANCRLMAGEKFLYFKIFSLVMNGLYFIIGLCLLISVRMSKPVLCSISIFLSIVNLVMTFLSIIVNAILHGTNNGTNSLLMMIAGVFLVPSQLYFMLAICSYRKQLLNEKEDEVPA